MARPKAFDEDTVLDAAAQLFWSQGYDGTSIADLEASMEMGRQSIYNAFGDKRDLFLKALKRYARWNRERLTHSLLDPEAGLQTIHDYFENMVDFVASTDQRRGCLVTNSIVELGDSDADISRGCEENQRMVVSGFEHALRNAVQNGELPGSLDIPATARMLLSQTYGMSVLSKAGMSREELASGARELLARLS